MTWTLVPALLLIVALVARDMLRRRRPHCHLLIDELRPCMTEHGTAGHVLVRVPCRGGRFRYVRDGRVHLDVDHDEARLLSSISSWSWGAPLRCLGIINPLRRDWRGRVVSRGPF